MDQSSSILTGQMELKPDLIPTFHSVWDNFDQNENNLTGASIHTAHGLLLQEVIEATEEEPSIKLELSSFERTHKATLTSLPVDELPPCIIGDKKGPPCSSNVKQSENSALEKEQGTETKRKDMAWVFIRHYKSSSGQDVPAWGGFIS